MNSETLTRKELYDLVWSKPFTTLAKKYLISDNGLRKICLKMDIPLPKSGHCSKTSLFSLPDTPQTQFHKSHTLKSSSMAYLGSCCS